MTIEVGEATVGMWCIELGRDANWLAHLARLPSGKFALDYRVRHYLDDKLEGSADRKNWYHGELTGPEARVLHNMRRVFDEMLERAPGHRGWELVKGERTVEQFLEALRQMPGIHVGKEIPA